MNTHLFLFGGSPPFTNVHFTEWDDESHLRNAVNKLQTSFNYGIDEKTGAYFQNGYLEATEGNGVYSIKNGVLVKISEKAFEIR